MARQITDAKWVFDRELWAADLKQHDAEFLAVLANVIGITQSGLYHWLNPEKRGVFVHPSMMNFLAACNELHLDPRHYFKVEVK